MIKRMWIYISIAIVVMIVSAYAISVGCVDIIINCTIAMMLLVGLMTAELIINITQDE